MATGKSSYPPASAHICGIAILNGVSSVQAKPRTVLLEVVFWTGKEPIIGLFQYFNGMPEIVFQPGERYHICATVRFPCHVFSPVPTLICSLDCFVRLRGCPSISGWPP